MGEYTFTPWRRYGHDRVYVQRGDDRVGYLDRKTGALVLANEAFRSDVDAALTAAGWSATAPAEPPPASVAAALGGGTFLHNGHRQDYVRKSRYEAKRVRRVLGAALGGQVDVRGVIVVIADSFTVKAQPTDVVVVARKRIRAWLTERPAVFDEAT